MITPKLPLLKGLPFVVQVSHYTAHPIVPTRTTCSRRAFFITPDGSATAGQPDGTHVFLPSNDHPRDKATFTIRFDVPAGETRSPTACCVQEHRRAGARTTSTCSASRWRPSSSSSRSAATRRSTAASTTASRARRDRAEPLRAAAVRQAAGRARPPRLDEGAGRRLPVRHLRLARGRRHARLRARDADALAVSTAVVRRHLRRPRRCGSRRWCTSSRTCGSATACAVRVERRVAQRGPRDLVRVALRGRARRARGEHRDRRLRRALCRSSTSSATSTATSSARSAGRRAAIRPQLFSPQPYYGGALVLYALRQKVGDATFQQIERAWVRATATESARPPTSSRSPRRSPART